MNDLHETHLHTKEESITPLFFKDIPSIPTPLSEDEEIFELQMEIFKSFSKIINESLYVLDFQKQCFHFVSGHDLFLSGFSLNDVLKMGYDFFSKIVHPDDLQMFIDIHRSILHYLSDSDGNLQEIDYFAFNVRLQNHGQPLMVYHKMVPIFINGHARMAICYLSGSVIRKPGKLELYSSDKEKYSQYSFKKQQWQQKELIKLTGREKDILKLAGQGKSRKEIANILRASDNTIRNQEAELYKKIGVQSMTEAYIYATKHQMIFANLTISDMKNKTSTVETNPKRKRYLLTKDMILLIQQGLDKHQSVNSIAKKTGISESTIRYTIKQRELKQYK